DSFVGDAPSTKAALAAVRDLTIRPRVLVVLDRDDTVTAKSLRNAELIATITFDQLNTYDVLLADDVVFTKAAFDAFVAARSAEGTETVKLSQAVVDADAPAPKPAKKTAKKVQAQAETTETVQADDAKAGATKTQP